MQEKNIKNIHAPRRCEAGSGPEIKPWIASSCLLANLRFDDAKRVNDAKRQSDAKRLNRRRYYAKRQSGVKHDKKQGKPEKRASLGKICNFAGKKLNKLGL